jgi:hypothetical protein
MSEESAEFVRRKSRMNTYPMKQAFAVRSFKILPRLLSAAVLLATALGSRAASLTPTEAQQIAEDAYIYGYSLITTEVTRVQMSNVPDVQGMKAPMGEFFNVQRYPPGDYRGVSAPNADTLYSLAWIDLGKEPIVFTYPDMGKRYFLFPMYSLWMPVVESLGSRTTGEAAGEYLITGPGWNGEVPAGLKQIKSPTRYFLILGRGWIGGRLQNRQRAPSPIQTRSAQLLRKTLHLRRAKSGGEPWLQHDRQAAGGHLGDEHV